MTAKDELVSWLTRNGVTFTEGVHGDDMRDEGCSFVRVERDSGARVWETKNSGYDCFFFEAIFTPDGALVRVGSWE